MDHDRRGTSSLETNSLDARQQAAAERWAACQKSAGRLPPTPTRERPEPEPKRERDYDRAGPEDLAQ